MFIHLISVVSVLKHVAITFHPWNWLCSQYLHLFFSENRVLVKDNLSNMCWNQESYDYTAFRNIQSCSVAGFKSSISVIADSSSLILDSLDVACTLTLRTSLLDPVVTSFRRGFTSINSITLCFFRYAMRCSWYFNSSCPWSIWYGVQMGGSDPHKICCARLWWEAPDEDVILVPVPFQWVSSPCYRHLPVIRLCMASWPQPESFLFFAANCRKRQSYSRQASAGYSLKAVPSIVAFPVLGWDVLPEPPLHSL